MNWVIIAVVSAATGLLMMGGDEPPAPPPVPVESTASFEPIANAMYWVGGCSVTCSLIWAGCIIYTGKLKRREWR